MYTLRKVTGNGSEINLFLGKSYTLTLAEKQTEIFQEMFRMYYGEHEKNENGRIYGFITDHEGEFHPLSDLQKSYIMILGDTVANLSKR